MAERWRDVDLLRALPYAKGDDRAVLFNALAHSAGSEGPTQLRLLYASETGPARSNALHALARRCGPTATDVLSEALLSRSIELQGKAASELAQVGTAEAADAVFEWLDRRLGRRRREATWDPYELPSAIRFAVRHGLHAEVARIIVRHWSALDRDEQHWLRRTWPAVFDGTGVPAVAAEVRPPDQVQEDVYEDQRGGRAVSPDEPEAWAKHDDEYIRKALKNAERIRLRGESDE
ncbi:HEAT repeat domain-containing protein [Nocardioides pelophilus]|uniref:HEAT repeat domain-containing protein n=1 Tax=Nocardioides pelophilus TaxID=2172019 RepID=UPI001601D058|nr:HEAT repeat domain-containing protein [Nocardioides pelophilus]